MTRVREGAIVGFGNVAAHGHVPGWRARPDFRIVAVCDPDPRRRAAAAEEIPGARLYSSVEDLLARERLDFVDVASPPSLHVGAIEAAAAAGVHVLCEKPLTTTWPEYERVRAAVRAAAGGAGVVLHAVHNWKYSEAFLAVRRLLADGAIGRLTSIVFDTARNGCAVTTGGPGDNWRMRSALSGGGILVDHGWHAFYLLLALAEQRPRRVQAALERRRYLDCEVEDTARCGIEFDSLSAEVRLTWAASERYTRWRLAGEGGELSIDDDRLVVRGREGERSRRLGASLSAGSHHPEWFAGVIDSFAAELDDPSARGASQAEAELCSLLLSLAYASAGQDSRPLAIPAPEEPGIVGAALTERVDPIRPAARKAERRNGSGK